MSQYANIGMSDQQATGCVHPMSSFSDNFVLPFMHETEINKDREFVSIQSYCFIQS